LQQEEGKRSGKYLALSNPGILELCMEYESLHLGNEILTRDHWIQ